MNRRFGFWPLLFVLAVIALTMRLVGIDWDRGTYLHPDERFVVWVTSDLRWPESLAQFFNAAASPLNPYNTEHGSFIYGTFPSFLVKAIAGVFGMDNYGELYLVGRAANAVFDTGTVVLTAIIARRFFGNRAGLLAGVLIAFTPLFLQTAHFFTVDTISVFFAIAAFACVLQSWDRSSIGWMAFAGVMVGLAGASKPNYLIALAFIGLPVLELVRLHGWRVLLPRLNEPVYPAIPAALTGGFVAFWTFRLGQPYAFSGPQWWNISLNQQWLDDLAFWRAVQTGLVDMKPSIQWIERTPVVYILQNMVLWGMGVGLGVLTLVALSFGCWRILRSARWPSWWFIGMAGWCLGSIAMYGTGIAQNQRYLMHIYPFLILLGAGFLIELESRLTRKWVAQLLTTAVVIYTVIFGIAFNSLYIRPITRIEASEWIYENLPDGAVISNEYWDDALPMSLPGEDRGRYTGMTLDLYADESEDNSKVSTLVAQLSQVDYVVLSSNRVIDSVVRQPERYPVAVRFYEMLLSGELGFEPVAEFQQRPEIFGIEWDDTSAEESLTVYEHPQVRIFRKTEQFNAQHVHDELNTAWGSGGYHYIPGDPLPHQMLMSESGITTLNEHGSWSDQVGSGWIQNHPLISWWVVLQIVGLAAWPLTWRAFRRLPDMGWLLAKAVGLVAMSAITLALISWGPLQLNRGTIALALLLLFGAGLVSERRLWNRFRDSVQCRWKTLLAGELVFSAVFLVMALLRSQQAILPDHALMQFTATMRSVSLPPFDPWLSGGVLHTHWAGLLPWVSLGRLLSFEPVMAYNLAGVGLMATIAGVVWSLLHSFTQSWLAALIAVVVVFGSSFAFGAGLAPITMSSSIAIPVLAAVLVAIVLIYVLIAEPRQYWMRMLVIAVITGALCVTVGWGLLVAMLLLVLGMAIAAWKRRLPNDSWWPTVRRFVLELLGLVAVGIAIWYPAYSAYTATRRNLVSPSLWSLSLLRDDVGIVLILLVTIVGGIGAANILGSLLDEGVPGISVGGIAIGSMIALLVLTWRMDSALMLILLVSLLAVTAIWHWFDDAIMLWVGGLILLSCGILVVCQAQQFHVDLDGGSSATQLMPLVWTFLILAVGFAAGRAIASMKPTSQLPAMAVAAIVAIALVIPAFDHSRQDGWEHRSAFAEPAIVASEGELEATRWMQENIVGMPTMLTADGPIGTMSAVTGYPSVVGNADVERRMRPGWDRMVDRRAGDVVAIYTGAHNWDAIYPLLEKYDVRYIVVGVEERQKFGPGIDQMFADAEAGGRLQLVFESEGVTIYQVIYESPPND